MSNQGADHTPVTGTTIEAVSDGKGVFVYRSSIGTGTFTSNGNKIQWKYSDDGLVDADQVALKVFTIEMVYVPEGKNSNRNYANRLSYPSPRREYDGCRGARSAE